MSTGRAAWFDATAARQRVDDASTTLTRIAVGDRFGLVVFLGTLTFAMATWRIGFFITDNYTPANALVALADGTLVVDEAVYGSLEAPGMQIHDSRLYGRNYGQVALAVPLLWALESLALVADPGLVFPALWSLLLLGFAVQVGRILGRESLYAAVGAVLALAAFAVNAVLAEPLGPNLLPLAALQLGTALAAALAGATMYRVLTRIHGVRAGVTAGVLTVVATPVGFWATIPKRHVTVVALLLGVVYSFYRSREPLESGSLLSPVGFRALAYALVGVVTWVHAGEGFVLFLALVLADVPTARSNDRSTVVTVGSVFALSMLPFFVTNVLISGDPVRPPRMLAQFGELIDESTFGSSGGSASGDASGDPILPPEVRGPVAELNNRVVLLFGPFVDGAQVVMERPRDIYQTTVRGGYIDSVTQLDNDEAINLSLLESMPLAAGVVATTTAAANRVRRHEPSSSADALRARLAAATRAHEWSAARATDALVCLSALFVFLVYIPRLPLHAQVTVRYLLPLYPLALYGVFRQASLARILVDHGPTALYSYLVGTLIGSQLLFVVVTVGTFGRGGAFQLHAVLGLVVGVAFALGTVAGAFDDRFDPVTAVTGGLAAAMGTNLILLSGLAYFQYGPYALPLTDWLADVLAAA